MSEEVFLPVFSLLKGCLTFLLKLQKQVAFQQGPRLAFSMKVKKMLQKSRKCYTSAARMELTTVGTLLGHLLSFNADNWICLISAFKSLIKLLTSSISFSGNWQSQQHGLMTFLHCVNFMYHGLKYFSVGYLYCNIFKVKRVFSEKIFSAVFNW